MLHLGGWIALSVDVRDFLELQSAFQSDREVELAAEEEEVVTILVFERDVLDVVVLFQD